VPDRFERQQAAGNLPERIKIMLHTPPRPGFIR
jgi:hypothetical protein